MSLYYADGFDWWGLVPSGAGYENTMWAWNGTLTSPLAVQGPTFGPGGKPYYKFPQNQAGQLLVGLQYDYFTTFANRAWSGAALGFRLSAANQPNQFLCFVIGGPNNTPTANTGLIGGIELNTDGSVSFLNSSEGAIFTSGPGVVPWGTECYITFYFSLATSGNLSIRFIVNVRDTITYDSTQILVGATPTTPNQFLTSFEFIVLNGPLYLTDLIVLDPQNPRNGETGQTTNLNTWVDSALGGGWTPGMQAQVLSLFPSALTAAIDPTIVTVVGAGDPISALNSRPFNLANQVKIAPKTDYLVQKPYTLGLNVGSTPFWSANAMGQGPGATILHTLDGMTVQSFSTSGLLANRYPTLNQANNEIAQQFNLAALSPFVVVPQVDFLIQGVPNNSAPSFDSQETLGLGPALALAAATSGNPFAIQMLNYNNYYPGGGPNQPDFVGATYNVLGAWTTLVGTTLLGGTTSSLHLPLTPTSQFPSAPYQFNYIQ